MKKKLISKCKHGEKVRDLNSQLLVQQSGPRGVVDTYDDGVHRLTSDPDLMAKARALPRLELTPEEIMFNTKYQQQGDVFHRINSRLSAIWDDIYATPLIHDYKPEYKTILDKYARFPKLFKKMYGVEPRLVTDSKGNTWYEVDVPKDYLNQEWAYKKGGKLIPRKTNK